MIFRPRQQSSPTAESALAESKNAFDVRYEYMNQDQPMAGSREITAGEVPSHQMKQAPATVTSC